MRRLSRIERRGLLTGWIKWAVLPLIPFCVLFFDAWLNLQIRAKDYELSELSAMRRTLNNELDATRAREARLSGVEHLTMMAEEMQLASPGPQQFRSVAYRDVPRRISVMNLAQAGAGTSNPTVINLLQPQNVAFAERVQPVPVASAPASPAPLLTPIAPMPESLPMFPEETTPPPATPGGASSYYDDPEFSLLTIEDMLSSL